MHQRASDPFTAPEPCPVPASVHDALQQDRDMRYVELRRHTDNDGDHLSEQGVADAEGIGQTGLHPPYAMFISTGAERASEMLSILRHAAGQDEIPITTETALRSVVEDRWREAAKAAGKGASLEEIRSVDPDLVEKESQLLGAALQRVVEGLSDDGRALVVGHSPTNEAAVCGLTNQVIAPLGKGEGVLVVEDAGRYEVHRL
jgi:broad specificity phosphatase PhoE